MVILMVMVRKYWHPNSSTLFSLACERFLISLLVIWFDYLIDYFVMWDEKIINSLIHSDDKLTSKARRQLSKLELPAGVIKSVVKESTFAKSSDSNWLSKAQDKML